MATSSSIALSMIDNYSKQLNSMANANKGFSKTMEEIQKAASKQNAELQQNQAKLALLRTELQKASNALQQAKKNFKASADEANSKALTEAFAKWENIKTSISEVSYRSKDAQTELRNLASQARRTVSDAQGVGGGSGVGSGLTGGGSDTLSGLLNRSFKSQFADAAANLAGQWAISFLGEPASNFLGSGISGAAAGFAMGGLPGAAVGAIAGLVNAGAEEWAEKDNYFKSAVQEDYNRIKQERAERVTSGTETSASREVDELAFNKLLGDGIGTAYLEDLRDMAAHTPMEYDQLTEISRQLAIGFGDESDRMLDLIEVVGDAGSAVGLDSSGMVTIATALSRMQSSDKVTLEYLNLIQERGIDAIGLIGQAKGLTTAQVYDAISKGQLDGSDVVDILQTGMGEKYGGAMEEQSQTYQGLSSTLSDQETERQNLTGEKYNQGRIGSMEQEIAFNDSEIGQKTAWVDSLFGSVQATAENKQKQFEQEALTFLHSGEGLGDEWKAQAADELAGLRKQYDKAYQKFLTSSGEERNLAAAEMKNIQDTARGLAESAYEMSDYYQALGDLDKDFIDGIQMAEANGYYELGYEIGQQLSKGIRAAVGGPLYVEDASRDRDNGIPDNNSQASAYRRRAYGLDRVPYNGYLASLHEGERVLTAQQARQMDAAGGHAGGVVITGNSFTVREEADIGRIASELVRQMKSAKMVYAGA